jgi:hypothetical protein
MSSSEPQQQTLIQFMALKLDLAEAVQEIDRLAEAGFGKRSLLKKDYQTLLDLMQDAVSSAKYAVSFLKLIFKFSNATTQARLSLEAVSTITRPPMEAAVAAEDTFSGDNTDDKLFESESCEVSPKNVLEASDRAFEEDFSRREDSDVVDHGAVIMERSGNSILERSGGSIQERSGDSILNMCGGSILENSGDRSDANVSQRRRKKDRQGRRI